MNLSLGSFSKFGGPCDGDVLKPAIDNLRSVGIATVAAAGNAGSVNAMSSPACISSVVSVAASYKTDIIAIWSDIAWFTSLVAPGAAVQSSIPGGGFAYYGGTSMAAPHVAGAWAVLKQAAPGASVTEILTPLQETGAPVTETRAGVTLTRPRIRVADALDRFVAAAPTVNITLPANGAAVSGTTTVAASASDNVGVVSVQFKLDGVNLGAANTAAPYTMAWDTTTAAPGTHTLTAVAKDAAGNTTTSAPVTVTGGTPASQPVVWTSAVKVAVSGNTIAKNAGCNGCGDAGAISQQTIPSGSGSVSFTLSAGAQATVGLSTGNAGTSGSEIKFGLRFYPGYVEVRESGVYKATWTIAAGAVHKIAVAGGVVTYSQNGTLKYTSAGSPTYPLVVDTSLNTLGSAVQNAVIGP